MFLPLVLSTSQPARSVHNTPRGSRHKHHCMRRRHSMEPLTELQEVAMNRGDHCVDTETGIQGSNISRSWLGNRRPPHPTQLGDSTTGTRFIDVWRTPAPTLAVPLRSRRGAVYIPQCSPRLAAVVSTEKQALQRKPAAWSAWCGLNSISRRQVSSRQASSSCPALRRRLIVSGRLTLEVSRTAVSCACVNRRETSNRYSPTNWYFVFKRSLTYCRPLQVRVL